MNPEYPIYVVSKGRYKSNITVNTLDRIGLPYFVVVESQEYQKYAEYIDPERLLVLPEEYLESYDTCDDIGDTKSKGPGPARNFCWDHSMHVIGSKWHWVMDDNFEWFYRLNRNRIIKVQTGSIFKASEDFVNRYENVYIAGFNYEKFCKSTDSLPPYIKNTRIYSCLLIRNDIPYRWRGRYNEDTDLCLRVLKDGFCTIQFNAFLCGKVTTQRMTGGNTIEFYKKEGTKSKSEMLENLHPDVATVVWKFNRWHHHVDYSSFKNNLLIRKSDIVIPDGINEYGMVIK